MEKLLLFLSLLLYCLDGVSQVNMVGKKAPVIEIEQWIYPKIKSPDWECKKVPEELNGKTIVLDFWFTRCAPCIASLPQLNHLAKHNPDIVFLSVTVDPEEDIERFLNKMILNYPVGIDKERQVVNAFNVSAFPQTFLIDKKGIVQWQGSPFHLDEIKLNELLGRESQTPNAQVNTQEVPISNSAYSFTIQKHMLELEVGTYFHIQPYSINVFNKDLETILKLFYDINKTRVLTKDSVLLNTPYDLILMADKHVTSHPKCVKMLKRFLSEYLDFELEEMKKDTIAGVLTVENDSLLERHLTTVDFLGTTMRYDNWEAQGITLTDLKNFLENNYNELIEIEVVDKRKFDIVIPSNNFIEAKEVLLNEYGLLIKNEKVEADFWEVEKI